MTPDSAALAAGPAIATARKIAKKGAPAWPCGLSENPIREHVVSSQGTTIGGTPGIRGGIETMGGGGAVVGRRGPVVGGSGGIG